MREYVKEIGEKNVNNDLREVTLNIINVTLRNHLTKYQADIRDWIDKASRKDEYTNLSPQSLQKEYPKYHELIGDMKKVNKDCFNYLSDLENIYKGGRINGKS